MTIKIARNNELKLTMPENLVSIKEDGTIWYKGIPILGCEDADRQKKIGALVRAGKFSEIPAKYFTRMGQNENGLWAGTDAEWKNHPVAIAKKQAAAEKAANAAKMVTISLSSRGWGDYSPCEWRGDITRPDSEILAECQKELADGHDVDFQNQTPEEILGKIHDARSKWEAAPVRKAAREAAEKADIERKIKDGYCFSCGSYCHGDCGHYSNDPAIMYRRKLK